MQRDTHTDTLFVSSLLSAPIGRNLDDNTLQSIAPTLGSIAYDATNDVLVYGSSTGWTANGNGDVVGPTGPTTPGNIATYGATGQELIESPVNISLAGDLTNVNSINNVPINDFAEYYALMPTDNAVAIAVDAAIAFPQSGPSTSTGITRPTTSTFQLADIGYYEISWQLSATGAAQVVLWLNSGAVADSVVAPAKIPRTVVGRTAANSQLTGRTIINTTDENTILSLRNGASGGTLTLTANAGGTDPVSANIIIKRIA